MSSRIFLIALILCVFPLQNAKAANCPVPNTLTNGTTADANAVMANFNSLASCAVATNGKSTSGSIAVFSSSGAINSGNLSGDITTSGATSTTLSNTGVVPGSYSSANIVIDSKGRVLSAASGAGSGGGVAPALLQTAAVRDNSGLTSLSANFSKPLSAGSLQIAIMTGFSNGSSFICQANFSPAMNGQAFAQYQGVLICARQTLANDPQSVSVNLSANPNGSTNFAIFEFLGVSGLTSSWSPGIQASNVWSTFSAKATSTSYAIGIFESDSANGLLGLSGATLLFDGTSGGAGNHPVVILSSQTLSDINLSFSNSNFSYSLVIWMNLNG